MDVRDRKIIVTGGVRGLGRAVVDTLLARGARVAVFDRDVSGLAALTAEAAVQTYACDLSSFDDVVTVAARYHEENGAADALVNNAGTLHSAPLLSISPAGLARHDIDAWNKVIATNLSSVFHMTLCIAEKMVSTRTRGVIVNISSVSAAGNAGQSAYSAAKAGVNALTMTWAKELSLLGIRVAGVAPGFTETPSTREVLSEAIVKDVVRKMPLRRLGRADEIAHGVLFVLENDFYHGRILELDGGLVV